MLLVDSRVGSKDLIQPLVELHAPVQETTLDAGDVALLNETNGQMLLIERKRVGDLLRVIADGRFVSEQLPKMEQQSHGRPWLVVEDEWKRGDSGELLLFGWRGGKPVWEPVTWGRQNGWRYDEVRHWLLSAMTTLAVVVAMTRSREETAELLVGLHRWWSKPAHKTAGSIYTPKLSGLAAPSLTRRFAALLPGVGQEKSAAVADEFGSPLDMLHTAGAISADVGCGLSPDEALRRWTRIPGIGKLTALKISEAVRSK